MAIVNGYDAYAINPDILSEYNVDQSGEVVSAEIWKALWDLVLGALIKYDRAFIDIYRTLADLNAELDSCIQRVDRIEKIYDALAERMATLEKTWTQLQDTYNKIAGHYEDIKAIHDALEEGLVHYGVDAPTLKYTKLWVMPTQFPLSPLRDVVNTIITSRTDSELNANSENPVQNKAIVKAIENLKKGTIIMKDNVNVWELEAGVYYVNTRVYYATPNPPSEPNRVDIHDKKGLLYVQVVESSNNTRDFYLVANNRLYFGYSTYVTGDVAKAVGSISSVYASIRTEITKGGVDGIPTKNAVYNFGENMKTELLANIGDKADKTDLEALKTEIQGNLDEIGDIIGGGTTEVLWSASLSGFTLNEDIGAYVAPYTGKLPAIESGAYKFEINNEIVDGLVTALEGITEISAYSQDMGQIDLVFGAAAGSVLSATEITNIDIKTLKTNEVVDYWLYVGSPSNNHQRTLTIYLPASCGFVTDELVSPDDLATGLFKITIATNDGSVSWDPGWCTYFYGTSDVYPNMIYFGDNSEISDELENALKNNTPVTVTISQENGITKVITDNYVVGNRYINNEYSAAYEQDVYYRWGNGGFLLTGSLLGS